MKFGLAAVGKDLEAKSRGHYLVFICDALTLPLLPPPHPNSSRATKEDVVQYL